MFSGWEESGEQMEPVLDMLNFINNYETNTLKLSS
jgi:hypothetical protein